MTGGSCVSELSLSQSSRRSDNCPICGGICDSWLFSTLSFSSVVSSPIAGGSFFSWLYDSHSSVRAGNCAISLETLVM